MQLCPAKQLQKAPFAPEPPVPHSASLAPQSPAVTALKDNSYLLNC